MVIVDNGNGNGREWEQRCWVDKLYPQSQSSDDDDKLSATPTNYIHSHRAVTTTTS